MSEDLSKYSEQELQAELKRRKDEAEATRLRVEQDLANKEYARIDAWLAVTEHTRTSCDDDDFWTNGPDYRCRRCTLLWFKAIGQWEPGYRVSVSVDSTPARR